MNTECKYHIAVGTAILGMVLILVGTLGKSYLSDTEVPRVVKVRDRVLTQLVYDNTLDSNVLYTSGRKILVVDERLKDEIRSPRFREAINKEIGLTLYQIDTVGYYFVLIAIDYDSDVGRSDLDDTIDNTEKGELINGKYKRKN